jgi:hypothetical protein
MAAAGAGSGCAGPAFRESPALTGTDMHAMRTKATKAAMKGLWKEGRKDGWMIFRVFKLASNFSGGVLRQDPRLRGYAVATKVPMLERLNSGTVSSKT